MIAATTKLTEAQANALKTIKKFGRSTDKRAVKALEKKGVIVILREERLAGSWGENGALAFFGYVK
jgi:hypothetical protein